jgi:hypothetical protein
MGLKADAKPRQPKEIAARKSLKSGSGTSSFLYIHITNSLARCPSFKSIRMELFRPADTELTFDSSKDFTPKARQYRRSSSIQMASE